MSGWNSRARPTKEEFELFWTALIAGISVAWPLQFGMARTKRDSVISVVLHVKRHVSHCPYYTAGPGSK